MRKMVNHSLNIPERMSRLILVSVLLLLLILPYIVGLEDLPLPACLFNTLTGLNCPTCGVSRAYFSTAHGSIGSAFQQNFVGILIYFGVSFYFFRYTLEVIQNRRIKITKSTVRHYIALTLFFSVWFSFWFIRLLKDSF